MNQLFNSILDFFFPKRCLACKQSGNYLCPECRAKLKLVDQYVCPVCEGPQRHGRTHPRCQSTLSLDGLLSGFVYANPWRQAIIKLKYRPFVFDAAEEITGLLLANEKFTAEINWLLADLSKTNVAIVPVPLHWWRFQKRGYNQAELTARILGRQFKLPMIPDLLVRERYTKQQRGLTLEQRRKNILSAFRLNEKSRRTVPQTVFLVDDIWTTGATLRTCGAVLKRAGVKKIYALTLAR